MIPPLQEEWSFSSGIDFICECFDDTCSTPISASLEEYEAIREGPCTFLVSPGHWDPQVEFSFAKSKNYWVVEKIEAGAEVAAALDPRAATRRTSALDFLALALAGACSG